ncbi:acid sphingomyelinase-like phosphodiesterase 3b [Trichonephila inaurata madagascariensis]|uniref:Acid sphingomyelinase-like phosphodiesterase 3b n=1 Tax=Trichonephila inaurata madagascariensis TaxID=2747483 RepID=A0A8X6X1F2_9ARAC|nr:acid sphingomyelinase-like phosphodiesterase 3b [Trichonephila inaurata madagascariensis]
MWKLKLCILLIVLFSVSKRIHCEDHGYFWHITDTHVDQNYSRTGNVKDMCHEDANPTQNNVSDNGLYGNFYCDAPQYLVNVTIAAMKEIHSNPDFIIWTGDNLPHTDDFYSDWDVIFEAIKNTTELLTTTFPNIPIIPCIGNHDTFPPNILPNDNTSSNIYKGYLDKAGWKDLVNESEWSNFLAGGYFSQLVKPGLRIISVNTILWYIPNNLTSDVPDPGNQFQWLEAVLKNSSSSLEKVYIIGHVPPGYYNRGGETSPTMHHQHAEAFTKILLKYLPIIAGQFYGHIHLDMFQIFQYNTGTFKGSSLLAPSVTPWHTNTDNNITLPVNPSVRLIHFSHIDSKLLDYDQYYLNLTKANSMKKVSEDLKNLYELLYTFTNFYGVPDLSTASLVKVYEDLKQNQTAYDLFFTFLTVGKKSVDCDSDCQVAQLCSMSCITDSEYNMCFRSSSYVVKPKLNSVVLFLCVALMITVTVMAAFYLYNKVWRSSSRHEYTRFSSI